MSTNTDEPVQSLPEVSTKDALESLRSPEQSEFTTPLPQRDSIATSVSELDDIALDDDETSSPTTTLSPVLTTPKPAYVSPPTAPLNLRSPTKAAHEASAEGNEQEVNGRPVNNEEMNDVDVNSSLAQKSHQKSASVTTIRSGHTLSFIEEKRRSTRISLDGQHALQEEFSRLQREKQAIQEQGAEGSIDWDFWGAVISDYAGFAAERPEELAQAIAKGIPATLRGMMWQHMAASKDLELENTYIKLLKETSTHEKSITRDLGRTFPHHAFFTDGQGIGQENLFNVLKAYSLYDPQVGYCQGLPFVVAVLLLNMPDEEAFSLLVRLMQVYDLRGHYLPEMPKLQMRLVNPFVFPYRFPLEIVFRIYDHCLANGIEAIFGFSIGLLKKNEESLLGFKFDEILDFLNNKLLDQYKIREDGDAVETVKYDVDGFVADAVSLKITPFMLDCYRHEYEDMVREANRHATQMDELRNNNRALSQQCKNLENSLAQLNTEHVEVLNELVKQRLRNEELEAELVRYKLLYAEAMHQNEDAQSSQRMSFAQMLMKRGTGLDHRLPRWLPELWNTMDEDFTTFPCPTSVTKNPGQAELLVIPYSSTPGAAILGAVDYKLTFARSYEDEGQYMEAVSLCHTRSAERVLKALLANGGIFIKLGQHMSSLIVLPREWTSTMRPLQDQCEPTAYEDVQKLFQSDMGASIDDLFEDFDPNPIGVASLAQVHIGRHKLTGIPVAVKLQHPHLAEFCDIDMEMVEVTLGWIKYWFPEFEFTWLADEMRQNLPKEMDFVHEANNAARAIRDFEGMRTSLYIPEVIAATKRVLIMEFIQGGRVDDLQYLANNNIDRNKVALELSRIFSQMVFVNGWFHADPHPGNLLIRPSSPHSRSPYNFEIVLLDHGLYFDLDDQLRVNYGRFWLSLTDDSSPSVQADRRKYAELVGNIGPDLYPVFEAAITGRAAMEGSWDDAGDQNFKRASGLIDMTPQSEEEMEAIRNAVVAQDGLILSVFDVLRRVPRRVLMVLKLNDLTRNLDNALSTTHSNIRIFLITAKYCAYAIWEDERKHIIDSIRVRGLLSIGLFRDYFTAWWRYESSYLKFLLYETLLDLRALNVKAKAWFRGLRARGLAGAHDAAAGLPVI
ncbi:hypothetical protein NP233_g1307 [Leucocoprinus birnbaumii]|uniref:Rab-GAP TBC domain-containing protein n=1 Tax=Leucocoprinus birnbaumii TaxID=56174 RepID=A0AAD5W2T7_9AGAR|nr:hypothetical protein NP233_g1307 [Leucocoprinus birnbaumii]